MQDRRKRSKAKKRAAKLLDEAWEAVAADDLARALRSAKRATVEDDLHPGAWNDLGLLLHRNGEIAEADRALRRAIQLAPRFAEAHANLAAIYEAEGKDEKAAHFLTAAIGLDSSDASWSERLRALEARAPEQEVAAALGQATVEAKFEPSERVRRYDWSALGEELVTRGAAKLRGLLTEDECVRLRELWADEERFEHVVQLDGEAEGRVAYRFFAPPLPEIVAALRADVYGCLAPVANLRQSRIDKPAVFPATHAEFLEACRHVGQHRSTPILLRYELGGSNGLHRDIAGKLVFPFQLAVTLGSDSWTEAGGGELVMVDERPGKKPRRIEIATQPGDGVVFCTRERLKMIAGIWGLQPVQHGVARVRCAERYSLGVPFHDYA